MYVMCLCVFLASIRYKKHMHTYVHTGVPQRHLMHSCRQQDRLTHEGYQEEQHIHTYIHTYMQEYRKGIPCIVVANKIDLDMKVTKKSFNFAAKRNLPFYFVSASEGTNVVKVFSEAITMGYTYLQNPDTWVLHARMCVRTHIHTFFWAFGDRHNDPCTLHVHRFSHMRDGSMLSSLVIIRALTYAHFLTP